MARHTPTRDSLASARVVVVGMGRSGRAAARLALAHGADVVCVDGKEVPAVDGARMECGPHQRATFLNADVVVVSPGVPAAQADVAAALDAGRDVVGELGFAWRFIQPATVAITGTNGKSTVTSFVGRLLASTGRRVFTGGNLGTPLSEAALEALDGPGPEVAAIEVSSYQMELPGSFDPRVGVVLNLTPDHLARHGTMRVYGEHKARIFDRMGPNDIAFVPAGDALLRELAPAAVLLGGSPGVEVVGQTATLNLPRRYAWRGASLEAAGPLQGAFDLSVVRVPGGHNAHNAATAAALAVALGADLAEVQGALAELTALPHRMEPVGTLDGNLWINDSKGTNVASTAVGLAGMDRPCVVLLGGEAKGAGFAALVPSLRRHRAVVCFGGSGGAIADELADAGLSVHRVAWMADAMRAARGLAHAGDAVLLSPGCASFDEFRNFEHRGDVFRAWVQGGGG